MHSRLSVELIDLALSVLCDTLGLPKLFIQPLNGSFHLTYKILELFDFCIG